MKSSGHFPWTGLVCFVLWSIGASAQHHEEEHSFHEEDYLAIWKNTAESDSVRGEALYQFLNRSVVIQPDTVFHYANALYLFGKSRVLELYMGHGLFFTGHGFYRMEDPGRAMEFLQRARRLYTEAGYKLGQARCDLAVGLMAYTARDYTKAQSVLESALELCTELKDTSRIAMAADWLASVYAFQGNIDLGLTTMQKSYNLVLTLGNPSREAEALHNLGAIASMKGDYPAAIQYHVKGLAILEHHHDEHAENHLVVGLGTVYKEAKDWGNAIKWCEKGRLSSIALHMPNRELIACECLYDAYRHTRQASKALVMNERILEIKEILKREDTQKKIQQLEFEQRRLQDSIFQARREQEVETLHAAEVKKKNKTRNALILIGSVLFCIAIGLFLRYRLVRKAKTAVEKEKDRSDHLLLNILPAEIADELKEKGRADARDFDMVSILFTDFKEFTKTAEGLNAQELVREINACFEAFDMICESYSIEKIKTIGDAYMAAGGLPVPEKDAVKNTVLAGLKMQEFIINRAMENEKQGTFSFQMRVGIHSGPVVAGIVGVKKFQYDIWGDTVNTASRMESNGAEGKVNVSQTIYEQLKDDPDFSFISRGKLNAKGKGDIDMYFVESRLI